MGVISDHTSKSFMQPKKIVKLALLFSIRLYNKLYVAI